MINSIQLKLIFILIIASFASSLQLYNKVTSLLKSKYLITTMSADRIVISTPLSPSAIGPYSQAIKANGFIFLSGLYFIIHVFISIML